MSEHSIAVAAAGQTVLLHSDTNYEIGRTFRGFVIGRDSEGVMFIGPVQVRTQSKRDADSWNVTLSAGAKLYTYSGRYGTLRGGASIASTIK